MRRKTAGERYRLFPNLLNLAWLDSRSLEIGPKALALREELMHNPQILVTKDRLFDVSWPDQAVWDAGLTTAIREIRRGLDDPTRAPLWIETHHGKGYRFLREVDSREVHPGRHARASSKAPATPKPFWKGERKHARPFGFAC